MKKNFRHYFNRRLLVVLLFGFTSGLPLALTGSTLQAWYKSSGVDIVTIGFLALVGQPYVYKFLWSPLLDYYIPPLLGRRRGWIFLAQVLIIVTIMVMALLTPDKQPIVLALLGVILAFFSATQDVAIDAYRIDILDADERGLGAAMYVEGYRAAMITSSGLGLILADNIGWRLTYLAMSSLMLLGLIVTMAAPEPAAPAVKTVSFRTILFDAINDFLSRDKAIILLTFILLYKLGDAFSHALSTAFLLDLNFSLTAVGTINKVVGVAASLIGIFVGGVLLTKISLYTALWFFGILQAATNLAFWALALVGKNYLMAVGAFFIESLCGGMGTAAFTAFLMSLCNQKYTATQYALLSSAIAVGRVFVGPCSGYMVAAWGWPLFYFLTACFALPGLCLLIRLRSPIQKLSTA